MLIATIMHFNNLWLIINSRKEHIVRNAHVIEYTIAREIINLWADKIIYYKLNFSLYEYRIIYLCFTITVAWLFITTLRVIEFHILKLS